jgi:signal transduction histidine kinase
MWMNRKLLRALIPWIFVFAALCSLGCEAGVLSGAQEPVKIDGSEIALLRDSTGTLTVEELGRADVAARFVQLQQAPVLGYEREVIWLRLRLQRLEDAPHRWFLEFSNPYVNDLRLYSQSGAGFTVAQAGDQFAFAQRALKFRFPTFALEFPDTQPQTFYLRLDSDSSLAGTLLAWQPDALRDKAQHELFYFGAVLGMIFMSFLVSIIHWLLSREPIILLFAILTTNTFLLVAVGLGLVAQFLTPTLPVVADLLVPWSLAFTTVSVGVVFGKALNIRADFPRMGQYFKLAYCLALALPFTRSFNLYSFWGGPALQLVSLSVECCTGYVSWIRWRSNIRGAGYYFAAHVVVLASLLMGRMILMGWLPTNALNYLSWVPGLLTFLFLVHAGVFIDAQSLRRERDAAFGEAKTASEVLLSERKMREEQTVFFSFVAHELRSPLAAILTGVKNLENELAGVSQQARARAQRIKTYAERLGSLIDRHLTLQRLGNADFVPQFALADPLQIADEGLRRVRAIFLDRVFEVDYAEGLPAFVSLDQDLLLMGLENLLINAAKFSPERGAVALDVYADSALHFRVSDRGPGIPADQIGRLFFIFNRTPQLDIKGGFGIGLAIAQRVAHVHGGILTYADRAGGGAVFTLTLPIACAPAGSSE